MKLNNSSSKSNCPKVVVIGIDGGTFNLIKPWAKEGKLPEFQKILDGGVHGKLKSTIPPVSSAAWPSAVTGKNPGQHGIYDFVETGNIFSEIKLVSSESRKCRAIWHFLNEAGRKTMVINVPLTYPPEKVDGIMISGSPTPLAALRSSSDESFVYPKELKTRLLKRGYETELNIYEFPMTLFGDKRQMVERIYEVMEKRHKIVLSLMDEYDWDFLMFVFKEADTLEHFFWHYQDPKHPDYRGDQNQFRDVILDYYKHLDRQMGRMLNNIDQEFTLFVISDHGSGPIQKRFYVNNWLIEQGLLKLKTFNRFYKGILVKLGLTKQNIFSIVIRFPIKRVLRMILSKRLKNPIIPRSFFNIGDVDFLKTKAYSPTPYWYIRLNMVGRDPEGIVKPGNEREKLTDDIMTKLSELVDPETKQEIVHSIHKAEDIYHGPYVGKAPDLTLEMNRGYVMEDTLGKKGIIEKNFKEYLPSAHHEPEGILMMMGPNVKKGKELDNARIMDIVPTIMYVMGLPIPSDMDGKVLTTAFESSFVKRNSPKYKKTVTRKETEEERVIYSKEAEDEIKKRLKTLGYL